jgi:hypothetical protein
LKIHTKAVVAVVQVVLEEVLQMDVKPIAVVLEMILL